MNRLQIELERLYGTGANPADGGHGARALVLELAHPAGWEQLSAVWRGVQSDLDLPAPAIAVSGSDALQLWFSLASPMAVDAGMRFLQGLRARYLADVKATHVRLFADAAEIPAAPPVATAEDRWSAFVTPDLASVFAETPWLDVPPTDEGQATLLRALEPIRQAVFEAASRQLAGIEDEPSREPAVARQPAPADVQAAEQAAGDAARFLAGVLNDETAPLASRIEAAKALLRR